jgi:hypothetical protein
VDEGGLGRCASGRNPFDTPGLGEKNNDSLAVYFYSIKKNPEASDTALLIRQLSMRKALIAAMGWKSSRRKSRIFILDSMHEI